MDSVLILELEKRREMFPTRGFSWHNCEANLQMLLSFLQALQNRSAISRNIASFLPSAGIRPAKWPA
jgi:hypothetical protein